MRTNSLLILAAAASSMALPMLSFGDEVKLSRNQVIPIMFETELNMKESRVGDRFTAKVGAAADLPYGTRMLGRISRIREANGDKPGSMDLEFTELVVPGGENVRISGVPISMDDREVRRGKDGRFFVKDDYRKRETYVFGGAAGGFILGSMVKKPLEGAIIGLLGGIAAAESDKSIRNDSVTKSGMKVGAILDRDLVVHFERLGRDDALAIRIGDQEMRFSGRDRAYYQGDDVMVPLDAAATRLGLTVDRGDRGNVYIDGKDCDLRLERNSKEYRMNGRRGSMDQPLVEKDGVLFVPAQLLAKMMGVEFSVVRG